MLEIFFLTSLTQDVCWTTVKYVEFLSIRKKLTRFVRRYRFELKYSIYNAFSISRVQPVLRRIVQLIGIISIVLSASTNETSTSCNVLHRACFLEFLCRLMDCLSAQCLSTRKFRLKSIANNQVQLTRLSLLFR